MMQTVGVLPPAAQMQAGGQPAAGYPQEGPVPYGGGAYPERPAKIVPYGGGAVIAGQAAVAATVPAAGGYPAAAGGGPAIVYATAAPVAYGNGAPAVDTSAITMGIVLPAVGGRVRGAHRRRHRSCAARGEVSWPSRYLVAI